MGTSMNKLTILFSIIFGLGLATSVEATTIKDRYGDPVVVSGCTLVSTQDEADAMHVYTLNVANVQDINSKYHSQWGRNARCDELQYHVLHNTTQRRLREWLNTVAFSWYRSIGTSRLVGTTIGNEGMFLVQRDGIHRVPDLLTAFSWGLISWDRFSLPRDQRTTFNAVVAMGDPLEFSDGPYAEKIRAVWQDGDRDFSTLPTRLADALDTYVNGYPKILSSCPTYKLGGTDRGQYTYFDWQWTKANPGYLLCPAASLEEDWRNNRITWP